MSIRVTIAVAAFGFFTCTSCAMISREEARATATRELQRRHCPLPRDYTARVSDQPLRTGAYTIQVSEYVRKVIDPPHRTLWEVTFYSPSRFKPLREIYGILVNARTGKVEDFVDLRHRVPPNP